MFSGSTEVSVLITPYNEHTPVFNPGVYAQTVSESTAFGATVETVTASDADNGPDGEIEFSIQSVTNSGSSLFDIDAVTGDILLIGTLDIETQSSYTITVRAADKGTSPGVLSADTSVVITVQDANDNTPICNPSVYNVDMAEGSASG